MSNKLYDYLIVGSGLFGSVFAYEMHKKGKSVLVIERRDHVGGNIHTRTIEDINVHWYGPHIFHTSNKNIWDYVNQFAEFNNFINSPLANFKDKHYNLPFNMNTFYQLWGTKTPEEAEEFINNQREFINEPKNLEEQALTLVGKDIYEKLIKGYTEKQWGRSALDIPAFIIKRIPLRFKYDNNYFNDIYQGIPKGGYTAIIKKMLEGIEVMTGQDYLKQKKYFNSIAKKVLYTGPIDELFDYSYGELEYRSLKFEHEVKNKINFQGNAVINFTSSDIPWTRIIEHKHFEFGEQDKTVVSKEYSVQWKKGDEPYYPINNTQNNAKYEKYKNLADEDSKLLLGGRLAEYKYYDMHQIIEKSLALVKDELET
jgi:UDP-galactopyranose mutase